MHETIKRWGEGGLIVGAFVGFALMVAVNVDIGITDTELFAYPTMMGICAVRGLLVGILFGLVACLFRRP
jgi:hypothetical protein